MATFLLAKDAEAVKISEISGFAVNSGTSTEGSPRAFIELFTENRVYTLNLQKEITTERVAQVITVAGNLCGSSVEWADVEEAIDKAEQAEEEFRQSVEDFKAEAKTVIGFIENFFSGK